jgi:hypothetical protein
MMTTLTLIALAGAVCGCWLVGRTLARGLWRLTEVK